MKMKPETFVSVDIETSGPIPGEYSMLSLGACIVGDSALNFYREFRPNADKFIPEALAVSGLQISKLNQSGTDPKQGMQEFKDWIETNSRGRRPVFAAFNAPFDWSFLNYYFHFYLGANPFGFSALDMKAFFMGLTGCTWDDTRSSRISEILNAETEIKHNALEDALAQARLFEKMRFLAKGNLLQDLTEYSRMKTDHPTCYIPLDLPFYAHLQDDGVRAILLWTECYYVLANTTAFGRSGESHA